MCKLHLFKKMPYLIHSLVAYLLLASLDTFHHYHAAKILGFSSAMHAFWLGILLIPVAISAAVYFVYRENKYVFRLYLLIIISAIVLPGFYHGGWDHLARIIPFFIDGSESMIIKPVFNVDIKHIWFYEFTGALEFFLAIILSYYTYQLLTSSTVNKL